MQKKRVLVIVIIISLGCLILALYPPVSENTRKKFRQQTIPTSVLEYGPTGTILKKLKTVYPIENQTPEFNYYQNVLEVIDRAKQDRKKWIKAGLYDQYRNSGIFCYLEMITEEDNVPFIVSYRGEDEWKEIESFRLSAGRDVYPFFLPIDDDRVNLDFFVRNRKQNVKVSTIVFLQPGYQPIAFYDPASYRNFLRNSENSGYQVESDSFQIFPRVKGNHHKVSLSFKKQGRSGISTFHKKQGRTRIEHTVEENQPLATQLPLTDEELKVLSKNGLPILAIDIKDEDLYSDEYGILKNYSGHGRSWERLARLRFSRNGDTLFDTFSGLRLQGGDPGREQGLVNFRVYFREEYGEPSIAGEVIFPGTEERIKRLAVKQSQWEKWPLNSPIAYDIARRLGALAPSTELIQLYLNGVNTGLYYLVPHLGETQIGLMFPEQELMYFRWRGLQHAADHHFVLNEFWFKLSKADTIDEEFAEQFFDLDNLTAQLFSVIFAGTGDFCQGLILKDTAPDSKMFWYMWDMDHSFVDILADIDNQQTANERWKKKPSVEEFFRVEEQVEINCPRVYLLKMLVNLDPAFKMKTLSSLVTALNHRLSDNYLTELLWDYWDKLDRIEYPHRQFYIGNLSEFFRHRKAFLAREIEALGFTPPLKTCTVTSTEYPFRIDDHLKKHSYVGYHFAGHPLSLVVDGVPEDVSVYVNDQFLDGNQLSYLVSNDEECRLNIDIRPQR